MKKFNLYNSKIFKFFDYIFRLVLINLFILLPSFLLFYIMTIFFEDLVNSAWGLLTLIPAVLYMYPAICAGVDLIRKYELKETNGVFKEFFKSLKRVYVKALLETIIILVFVVLFYFSISHFARYYNDGVINVIGLYLSIAFAIMLLVIIVHLPLVMNYMEGCLIIDDIKLAGMMAFQDLIITIGIVIFIIAIMVTISYNKFRFAIIKIDEAENNIGVLLDKKRELLERTRPIIKKELKKEEFMVNLDNYDSESSNIDNHNLLKGCYNELFKILDIILEKKELIKSEINHAFIPTKNQDKSELLLSLLKTFEPYLCLIFANTKEKVNELASFLADNGVVCTKLTGDLQPRERKQVLKRIKDGAFKYVVCSDIASRGLDITGVSHVITYELPKDIVEVSVSSVYKVDKRLLYNINIDFNIYKSL